MLHEVIYGLGFNFSDFVHNDMVDTNYKRKEFGKQYALKDKGVQLAFKNHLRGNNNINEDGSFVDQDFADLDSI